MWLPLMLIVSLWLLPRVKGALVGLQWALRMHGFGGPDEAEGEPAKPAERSRSGRGVGHGDAIPGSRRAAAFRDVRPRRGDAASSRTGRASRGY